MEKKPANYVATVNGHEIYRDGDSFSVWTKGVGWWAFHLPSEAEARTTCEAVSAPEAS